MSATAVAPAAPAGAEAVPAAPPAAEERLERWATPTILWGSLGAICLGALLLFLAARSAVDGARQAVQTIGRDAAPSIIAAQAIRAGLADMDANAANALLVDS